MSAYSNYMENLILNVFLRANPDDFSPAPAVYLALYTSNPDEDNSGTEVSSTNTAYVRQLVTLSVPTDGVASNTNVLTFPIATSSWGTITHIGLMDDQTEGNLLYYGAVTPSNTVAAGGRMEFPVGSVQVSSSGSFGTYFANAIIDYFLRGNPDAIEPPASTYLALYTANPTVADAGVEVEGASYARQPLVFGEPGDGVVANTQAIIYPIATEAWGTVTHVGIRDALTEGGLLYFGAISPSNTIAVSGRMELPIGAIQVTNQ